ncbi:MAG: DUF4271 domain-containing protein [Bacteroidales bacterium]|nr:DUF4271 domain-containing protein [Bacteroidales bacterium]
MIQVDSLNIIAGSEGFSLQKNKDSLSRFFVEKGKVQINEIKRVENELIPLWIHLSLLFWVFIVVFIRQSYAFRMRQIIIATLKPQQVKQLLREGALLRQGFPVILLLLYYFTISLFAFLVLGSQYPKSFYFSFGEGFLLLFVAVFLYHALKYVIIWILGFLFETQDISFRYLLDHYLFHISEGLVLFPLLILFIYSGLPLFLYVALIVLLALWFFRLQRAIVIGLACTKFSPSYLFLYLCTLEVVPFVLLYKLGLQFI